MQAELAALEMEPDDANSQVVHLQKGNSVNKVNRQGTADTIPAS